MTASTEINNPDYNSHRVAAATSPKRYSVRSLIFSAVCPRRASASFDSVLDAVEGAITIQKAFAAHNQANPDAAMHLRIGISAGEPIEEHGDLFGAL